MSFEDIEILQVHFVSDGSPDNPQSLLAAGDAQQQTQIVVGDSFNRFGRRTTDKQFRRFATLVENKCQNEN